MIYLILLGILFFIQLFAASWYDLAKKATDGEKTFKHKMICSGIYMAGIFLCTAIKKDTGNIYSLLFFVAFIFLFIHDIIEEKNTKATRVISTTLCFSGYTAIGFALFYENQVLFNENQLNIEIQLVIPAVILFMCTIILIKSIAFSQLTASAYLLLGALITGIHLHQTGNPQNQAASCAIILGATALFVSSFILAFDRRNRQSLLRINLYYFGLMFIFCSVAVI